MSDPRRRADVAAHRPQIAAPRRRARSALLSPGSRLPVNRTRALLLTAAPVPSYSRTAERQPNRERRGFVTLSAEEPAHHTT